MAEAVAEAAEATVAEGAGGVTEAGAEAGAGRGRQRKRLATVVAQQAVSSRPRVTLTLTAIVQSTDSLGQTWSVVFIDCHVVSSYFIVIVSAE